MYFSSLKKQGREGFRFKWKLWQIFSYLWWENHETLVGIISTLIRCKVFGSKVAFDFKIKSQSNSFLIVMLILTTFILLICLKIVLSYKMIPVVISSLGRTSQVRPVAAFVKATFQIIASITLNHLQKNLYHMALHIINSNIKLPKNYQP